MKLYLLVLSLALSQLVSSQTPSTWTEVTPAQLNENTAIQGALTFGVGQVIQIAIEAGNFPHSVYDVIGIYSVLQQVDANGTNYRFEVQVNTTEGQLRRVKYDVQIPAAGGERQVPRYMYGALNGTSWTAAELGAFTFLPRGVYRSTVGQWTEVTPAQLNDNTSIQDALVFGVGFVIQVAVEAGDFPNSDYDVSGIYSVLQQVVNGINYRFEVQVNTTEGELRRVKCDVNVPTAGERQVPRYIYGPLNSTSWTIAELGAFTFLPEGVYERNEALVAPAAGTTPAAATPAAATPAAATPATATPAAATPAAAAGAGTAPAVAPAI